MVAELAGGIYNQTALSDQYRQPGVGLSLGFRPAS